MQGAMAQATLLIYEGSLEPSLLDNAISIKISCNGSFLVSCGKILIFMLVHENVFLI